MFDVGFGIRKKMEELGDVAIRDSKFYHPKGQPEITTERGYGFLYNYTASNVTGSWIVAAYYLGTEVELPTQPTPPETTLVKAIDVSSHQPANLTNLIQIHQPEHVIVKLYQDIEQPPQQHSIDQLRSALDNGCTLGGYVWLYHNIDVRQQIDSAISVLPLGIAIPILWIDVERYTDGSIPTWHEVVDAVRYATEQYGQAGIYTGKWVWDILGNPIGLGHIPLWYSHYDIQPTLKLPSPFGGWTEAVGHQYTSDPVDLNIFDRKYTEVA